LEVELREPTTVVAKHKEDVLICHLQSQGPALQLRLVRGDTSPLQGWIALSSARVAPAWVLVAEVGVVLPYELDFHFYIHAGTNELAASPGSCNEVESNLPESAGAHV